MWPSPGSGLVGPVSVPMPGALGGGVPPCRQRYSDDARCRLIRMQAEAPQRLGGYVQRIGTVPPAGCIRTADQVDPDLVVSERHPVDAALAQSKPEGCLRPRVAWEVLVL